MAEIINLNRHRKARARAQKAPAAALNRATHGISSVERAIARLEDKRAHEALEGKRLDPTPPAFPPFGPRKR
jgi:hypothetical protein